MKVLKLIVLLTAVSLFTSCSFKEEITIKKDGSGEFIMSYDMSKIMTLMEGISGEKKDESEKKEAAEVVDSTFYFKDMLAERADSISKLPIKEQEKLQSLASVVMKMKMNENTGEFLFGFGSSFNSLKELPQTLKKIDAAKKMNSKDQAQFDKMSSSEVAKSAENTLENITFNFDGSTFSRVYKSPEEKVSSEELESLNNEMNSMGEEAKDLFKTMSYDLVYHFPKKVKSVSNKDAVISEDEKTVTLSLNFLDMIKNPDFNNLEVKLED